MEEGKGGRAEGRDEGKSEDWKRGKRWNATALGSLSSSLFIQSIYLLAKSIQSRAGR